jgi:hypothetical protein
MGFNGINSQLNINKMQIDAKGTKNCSWFWWFMTMVLKTHRSKETRLQNPSYDP